MRHPLVLAAFLAAPAFAADAPPKPETPADVVAAAPASEWKAIDPADLLVIDFANGKRTVIQLAPAFAPVHVANVKALARGGWWAKGAAVYRVQDNYVAQWGVNDAEAPLPKGVVAKPPAEYWRSLGTLRPLGLPGRDSYAPAAGYLENWPVAFDAKAASASLPHCYGMVGVGRDLAPDTGMGGELYAVIGHAPRQLDRNIAVIGRVVDGMENLSALPRGTEALGFYKERSSDVPIKAVRIAADMPAAERPAYELLDQASPSFARYLHLRANRQDAFYERPAGGVDICNAPVPVRKKG